MLELHGSPRLTFDDSNRISNNAVVVATETLIDEFLPFQEMQLRRPEKLDYSIKTCNNCRCACADQIFAI